MIGQRLARDLPPRDSTTVGEYGQKKCVDAGTLLKHIKDPFSAFIDKRNCSHLNADHFGGDSRVGWSWHRQGGTGPSSELQEIAAIYV
jgi:hypothetical protein